MGRMMSEREFERNPGEATRAAEEGPVIVTDDGEPAYVLLTYGTYRRLSGDGARSIVDRLRQDGAEAGFDFEPPRLDGTVGRPADVE